ncbi:MAG: hypothetical protein J0I21_10575 [Alphaproteobacteria bacterium]|nr:hypothetical protein [Alphaproteobacteria bacterium]
MAAASGAVSNFTSFLQSQGHAPALGEPPVPADPVSRLLVAVHRRTLMPLAEVATDVRLPPADALALVERMRAQQLVEVVKVGDDGVLCLRLTPHGFRTLVPA